MYTSANPACPSIDWGLLGCLVHKFLKVMCISKDSCVQSIRQCTDLRLRCLHFQFLQLMIAEDDGGREQSVYIVMWHTPVECMRVSSERPEFVFISNKVESLNESFYARKCHLLLCLSLSPHQKKCPADYVRRRQFLLHYLNLSMQ